MRRENIRYADLEFYKVRLPDKPAVALPIDWSKLNVSPEQSLRSCKDSAVASSKVRAEAQKVDAAAWGMHTHAAAEMQWQSIGQSAVAAEPPVENNDILTDSNNIALAMPCRWKSIGFSRTPRTAQKAKGCRLHSQEVIGERIQKVEVIGQRAQQVKSPTWAPPPKLRHSMQ